jgi:hypothetical protein
MLRRLFAIVLLAAIPAFFVTPAAKADNPIVFNQWYTAGFGVAIPSPVSSSIFALGTDGEILPSGTETSIAAPSGAGWIINGAGTLTLTDLETSGDQFEVFDNGVAMALAASPFAIPGQSGYISSGNSYTSAPCFECDEGAVDDIDYALGDANYSSGTFALLPGSNDITIDYVGSVGDGDMSFIAETAATPEPSSLVLLATGLLGVLFAFRRKLMA